LIARNDDALLLGKDFGLDLVDAERTRNSLGGGFVITGHHDDLQSLRSQRLHSRRRARLDRIGNGKRPGERAIDANQNRCHPI
jgi:hypothetical protein